MNNCECDSNENNSNKCDERVSDNNRDENKGDNSFDVSTYES